MTNEEILFPQVQIREPSTSRVTISIRPPKIKGFNQISNSMPSNSFKTSKNDNEYTNSESLLKQKYDILNEIEELQLENDSLKKELASKKKRVDKEKYEEISDLKMFPEKRKEMIQEERVFKIKKKLSALQEEDKKLDEKTNFYNSTINQTVESNLSDYIIKQYLEITSLSTEINKIKEIESYMINELNETYSPKQQHFYKNKKTILELQSIYKKLKLEENNLNLQINLHSNSTVAPKDLISERDKLANQLSIVQHRKIKYIQERDNLLKMHVSKIQEMKKKSQQKKDQESNYINQRNKFRSMMKKKKCDERQRILQKLEKKSKNDEDNDEFDEIIINESDIDDWNEITFVRNAKDESCFDEEEDDQIINDNCITLESQTIISIAIDDKNTNNNIKETNKCSKKHNTKDKDRINDEEENNQKKNDKNLKNDENHSISTDSSDKNKSEKISDKFRRKYKTRAEIQKEKELELEKEAQSIANEILNFSIEPDIDISPKERLSPNKNSKVKSSKESSSENLFSDDFEDDSESKDDDSDTNKFEEDSSENESSNTDKEDESDQFEEDFDEDEDRKYNVSPDDVLEKDDYENMFEEEVNEDEINSQNEFEEDEDD